MTIYIILIALMIVLFTIAGGRKNTQRLVLAIGFFLLWLLASFKGVDVGADSTAYYAYFNNVYNGLIDPLQEGSIFFSGEDMGFEYGYRLYNLLIVQFTGSFFVFSAIMYAFIYYSFYRYIVRNSYDYRISFIVFYALMFFGSLVFFREYIALAILTWSYKFLIEMKPWRFVMIVLFATLFHQMSIIFLLAYALRLANLRYNARTVVLMSLFASVGFVVVPLLIGIAASVSPRYGVYLDKVNSFEVGSILILFILLGVFLAMSYLYSKIKDKTSLDTYNLYVVALMCVVGILSVRVSWFARVGDYFTILAVIGIAHLVYRSGGVQKNYKLTIALLVYILLFAFASLWLKPEWLQIVPYTTIIQSGGV